VAGLLIGVLSLAEHESSFWRQVVVPVSTLVMGWIFLGYALTGRRALLWFRRPTDPAKPKASEDGRAF
jgi:hypothetical protein